MLYNIHLTPTSSELTVDSYKAKIKYIIQTDYSNFDALQNDLDKVNFLVNHFVMTDYDSRQMSNLIYQKGISTFISIVDSLNPNL